MVDKQLRAEAQEEEKRQNRDVEHRAAADGEGWLQAYQGDERGVEQELRGVEQTQHEPCSGAVLLYGGVAAALLPHPLAEAARRGGEDGVVGVNQHLGILFGGHLADEEVVVANGGGVVRSEAFVSVKQLLAIRKVFPDAHVRPTCQRCREVKQGVLYRIKAYQSVEQAFLADKRAVADDDFGVLVVAVHKAAQPLVVGGHTVAVGEDDEVVLRRLDAHRERELLAIEEVEVLLELHGPDAWLATFKVFEVFLGLVVGAVVDDDEFKIGIILIEKHGNKLNKILVSISCTKNYGNRLQVAVVFARSLVLVEGDSRKHTPMVEKLDDEGDSKNE